MHAQLVLMSIEPGDEIGLETHHLDQFIRIEEGKARVEIDGEIHEVGDDWAVIIPAGTKHNVTNVGDVPLKLYSLYAPPEHKDGTVHHTKADDAEEHWDGVPTE
jgi:mannose-6-phosphate isomerase-like protein (cupin superfamily)